MICRPEHPTEHPTIRRIVEQAFGDHGPSVAALIEALADDTATSLVAEHQNEVIGHARLSRSWIDAQECLVDVLVLSPLAVRPDMQGRGAGTALLAAAVEAATQSGAPALFLEGPPDYYGRRGFARADEHGFTRPSVRIPEAAFQVALLPAHEPWMTGALVYCQAFRETDCVGLRGAGPAPSTTPATAH